MRFKQEGRGESGLALVAWVCCGIGCTGKDKTVDSAGGGQDTAQVHRLEKLLACGYPQVCEVDDIFYPPIAQGTEWTENQKCILTALAGDGPFMLHGAMDGVRADGYVNYEAYALVGEDRTGVELWSVEGDDGRLFWDKPSQRSLKDPEWFQSCLQDWTNLTDPSQCMNIVHWFSGVRDEVEMTCP